MHASRSPEGTDLYVKYRAILALPGPLALDRSFVSELVYGPLEHGRSRLPFHQAARLAGLVAERGGALVFLSCEPEQVAARLMFRDGRAPALLHIRKLADAYVRVFAELAAYAPVVTIDTSAT
jgi:hypothetical protein